MSVSKHWIVKRKLEKILLVGACLLAVGIQQEALGRTIPAIRSAGQYSSPDGRCKITLTIGMGEALVLSAHKHPIAKGEDVTGIVWASNRVLVYSVSPIYGKPGIYIYDCVLNGSERIVAPKSYNKYYPDGTDFFELKSITLGNPTTIYFYYSPDVDKTDFTKFRTPAYLFQVYVDGNGFHKTK